MKTNRENYIIMMHHLWRAAYEGKNLGKYDLESAWAYFEQIEKNGGGDSVSAPSITANGRKILATMQKMQSANANMWTAKEIGEAGGLASASVAGGMRKLIKDGFVEKGMPGSTTNFYKLTEQGISTKV